MLARDSFFFGFQDYAIWVFSKQSNLLMVVIHVMRVNATHAMGLWLGWWVRWTLTGSVIVQPGLAWPGTAVGSSRAQPDASEPRETRTCANGCCKKNYWKKA